ncbi:hypothetical protein ASD44_17630 [Mesorhizobium sp. Root554]|uniref:hypothetical protein n=1 Tax=unclassified Mesorhizobium TaxID=325217 RepID=UPI0006F47FE5|nr:MULTISPECIES: hypothetical protein [unclassified Mesorhizobium]KQZ15668.1 hypothetical protein ASD27_17635 [Mesorhizobium sp. Root1471]KQZ38176.1 hypothetical protein ASD44_17630 [Mesorhizobium sp. Root554]
MSDNPRTSKAATAPKSQGDQRKARLAEQLRANLAKRKAQVRSRRTGQANMRPEGIETSEDSSDG